MNASDRFSPPHSASLKDGKLDIRFTILVVDRRSDSFRMVHDKKDRYSIMSSSLSHTADAKQSVPEAHLLMFLIIKSHCLIGPASFPDSDSQILTLVNC